MLHASVFVFECFVFETTVKRLVACGPGMSSVCYCEFNIHVQYSPLVQVINHKTKVAKLCNNLLVQLLNVIDGPLSQKVVLVKLHLWEQREGLQLLLLLLLVAL